MSDNAQEHHIVPNKLLFLVYGSLLVLTGVTIWVAGLHLGNFSTFAAMFIASIKATLVLMFFMHLRYEKPMFTYMALTCIATLTVIILMTFTDVWFR